MDRLEQQSAMAPDGAGVAMPAGMLPASGLPTQTVVVQAVTGTQDYYHVVIDILRGECARLFLMQRSSSLVLGPEQGWEAENAFYECLMQKLDREIELMHVVSLDGLASHLARAGSVFPNLSSALARLTDVGGLVALRGGGRLNYLKRISTLEEDQYVKADRQGRLLLAEMADGTAEAALVFALGSTQTCFHLRGPEIARYFQECAGFYSTCHDLRWDELRSTVGIHSHIRH